jgi:hypothetical protein
MDAHEKMKAEQQRTARRPGQMIIPRGPRLGNEGVLFDNVRYVAQL